MQIKGFHYPRQQLSEQLADAITGRGPFDYRSGLFLAAPRRTGKSTFLRLDLVPELERRGYLPVYVDLWSDRSADPGLLIGKAVAEAARPYANILVRLLRATGLKKAGVGGIGTIEFDVPGQNGGSSLADAISHLASKSGRPIALIVDEAQHALSSDGGRNAMFALKAARDALNQTAKSATSAPDLALIFTGSHRDKLAQLIIRRESPFFGAQIMQFPLLDRNYCIALTNWMNERLASDNRFESAAVFAAFDLLGRRPELLQTAMQTTAMSAQKAADCQALEDHADDLRTSLWEEYKRDYELLTDLQQHVLHHLVANGDNFAPFEAATLEAVGQRLGREVKASSVQQALESLRERNIIWKSGRGAYALEDPAMAEWMAQISATPNRS